MDVIFRALSDAEGLRGERLRSIVNGPGGEAQRGALRRGPVREREVESLQRHARRLGERPRPALQQQRLDPATDGRPDPRPGVRENNALLGDLRSDFDFSQRPRRGVMLPSNPAPGPASSPP